MVNKKRDEEFDRLLRDLEKIDKRLRQTADEQNKSEGTTGKIEEIP
jgi:uncharacterized membrane protein YukC